MTKPWPDGSDALVVATYGRRLLLQLEPGDRVAARVKGKRLKPVCGDRVGAEPIPGEPDWLVTRISPRSNELSRPDGRGRTEVLAANLTFLAVVAAQLPAPDWFVVDRYLCAAELMHVSAAVLFNKIDLLESGDLPEALADYSRIGYPTLPCSARTGVGIDALEDLLKGHTAIIVGLSGVGKSSVINRLSEDADQPTAEISASSGEGRHTTVASVMLRLPNGGAVIDSPGVRDYAPHAESVWDVIHGFREIEQTGGDCRFSDCRHLREPDCAVKDALDNGTIGARRYESYRRLAALTEKLAKDRY